MSCPSSKNTLQPKQKKADLQEKKFGNQIVSILTKNLFFSLKEISNALGGKINTKIIRNILKKRGYKYKKFNPVPFISALQKQRRIEFSVSHIFNNTDFSGVVFSDEKKFNLRGPDRSLMIWSNLAQKYQNKESIMVHASFCAEKKFPINSVEEKLNSLKYQNLLRDKVFPQIKTYFGSKKFIWQQDNAPCHVSKSTLEFLNEENVKTMKWPANSPDLNPIENLWSVVSYKVYKTQKVYFSKQSLWDEIPTSLTRKLVKSMKDRLKAVLLGNGNITSF